MQSFTASSTSTGATSTELKTWLESTSLFDSVSIDTESTPEKVICTKDGQEAVYFTHPGGTQTSWLVYVHADDFTNWVSVTGSLAITCSYGVSAAQGLIVSVSNLYASTGGAIGSHILIGKASSGAIVVCYVAARNASMGSKTFTYIVPISTEDDSANVLFVTQANSNKIWCLTSFGLAPHDRTILEKIFTVGKTGSSGYIATIFNTPITQFTGITEITLNNHNYASILGLYALLDE